MKTVMFTDEECQVLFDLLDYWAGDMESALDDTMEDPLIETPEQLLQMSDGLRDQASCVAMIQAKLQQ